MLVTSVCLSVCLSTPEKKSKSQMHLAQCPLVNSICYIGVRLTARRIIKHPAFYIKINVRGNGTRLAHHLGIRNLYPGNSARKTIMFFFSSAGIHHGIVSVSFHHGRRRQSAAPRIPSLLANESRHAQFLYLSTKYLIHLPGEQQIYHGISQ
jgi:hypothetical protein